MKRSHVFGVGTGFLVGCALTWLVAASPVDSKPRQWEYKLVGCPNSPENFEGSQGGLNELGAEGWEVVSVTPPNEKNYQYWFCLKRQK